MWVAVWIVSHTFTITMAIFDVGQNVVSRAAGVIEFSRRAINIDTMISTMETAMESMEIGELVDTGTGNDSGKPVYEDYFSFYYSDFLWTYD